jgi:hypothetical protein
MRCADARRFRLPKAGEERLRSLLGASRWQSSSQGQDTDEAHPADWTKDQERQGRTDSSAGYALTRFKTNLGLCVPSNQATSSVNSSK